jgi:hypothetical protein
MKLLLIRGLGALGHARMLHHGQPFEVLLAFKTRGLPRKLHVLNLHALNLRRQQFVRLSLILFSCTPWFAS